MMDIDAAYPPEFQLFAKIPALFLIIVLQFKNQMKS